MEERRLDLSKYRLEKAKDDLSVAKLNLDNKKFSQSINRSYYSIFHAVRAILALIKFDSKKHSTIISLFHQEYIKPGSIEPEYYKMLTGAFKIRNDCDYDDFFVASHEDAKIQYEGASKFIHRIEEFIKNVIEAQKPEVNNSTPDQEA